MAPLPKPKTAVNVAEPVEGAAGLVSPPATPPPTAAVPPLSIRDGKFYDPAGREVTLRGINFAGDAKFPFHEGTDSYVDSPFPLAEADAHLRRLRALGFNCIRYLYTWDALEHAGPGQYDEAYIDYTIAMLRKCGEYGFYVFMDPHQDVWSRFSGGSGAPEWTLHAAGLDPATFEDTHAAVLYTPDNPHRIKMVWASNYHRLVSQTMFTLFFAGETFAPKCTINDINVGTYLHEHFLNAVEHFVTRVRDADLGPFLLGWESVNEPGHGLVGYEDLEVFPTDPGHVKLGTAPTPFQAMLLGSGVPQTVDYYRFTPLGLRRESSVTISPQKPAWLGTEALREIDARHGWKRSWPGGCIWELHGIYDRERRKLLAPYYFTDHLPPMPKGGLNVFVEHFFLSHWDRFRKIIEKHSDKWWVFMQAPVNMPPPNVVAQAYALDLTRTVYTPHYYDGLTLMLKRWRWMNVDAVGVCRHLYASPVLAVKIGSRAIRNSFDTQLAYLKTEGLRRVGPVPVLISEIGIPYDMEQKRAYTTGYYDDQVQAMDANHHALEASRLSHTLWVYTGRNSHKHGDSWCGEDLSIWSADDMANSEGAHDPAAAGIRAAPAVVRPTPIAVNGRINSYSFDIYKAQFSLALTAASAGRSKSPRAAKALNGAAAGSPDRAPGARLDLSTATPTTVYLPRYYFGDDPKGIVVSSGRYEVRENVLYWYHGGGPQLLSVRGEPHFSNSLYSYVDPFVKFATNSYKVLSSRVQPRSSPPRN